MKVRIETGEYAKTHKVFLDDVDVSDDAIELHVEMHPYALAKVTIVFQPESVSLNLDEADMKRLVQLP